MLHVVGVDIEGDRSIRRKPGCMTRVKRENLNKNGLYSEPKISPWFEPVHLIPDALDGNNRNYSYEMEKTFVRYVFSLKIQFFDRKTFMERTGHSKENLDICFYHWS